MRVVLAFIILMLTVACQGVQTVPKPENLIAKVTMEAVIYDMALITSARGYNRQKFAQTGVDPECHIFEKYEIDSAQYAQSTLYYSSSLEEYKELIEKVKRRLESEHKELEALYKEEKRIKDSIRNARGKRLKKEKDSIKQIEILKEGIPDKTVIEAQLPNL